MANKFTLTITAVDKATAVVRGVNKAMAKLGSPVTNIRSAFKALNKEIGENPLIKTAGKIGQGIGKALGQIGKFVPEAGEFAGLAGEIGAVAGSIGLLGGAVLASAAAVAVATIAFARFGFALKQTAINLGMSTQQVQGWHAAAGLMGVDAKAVDSSFQSLGDTIQDATMGRNQSALMFMNRLGISLKRTKTGAVDVNDEMLQLADAIKKFDGNPEVQRMIARQFGVEAMLPSLRLGRKAMEQQLKDQKKWALSDKEIDDANKFNLALAKVVATAKGFTVHAFAGIFHGVVAALRGIRDGWQALTQFLGGIWDGLVSKVTAGIQTVKDLIDGAKHLAGKVGEAVKSGVTKAAGATKAWVAHAGDAVLDGLHIKRNNPGNIRPLNGQGFNTYSTLNEGLAAMGRQLQIYQDKHHLSTISAIIRRWAPPGDHNDTNAYIANVARRTGFGADQALNLHDPAVLAALERAMIKQEHGANISQDAILAALGAPGASGGAGANGVRAGGSVDVNVSVKHDGRAATVKTATAGAVTASPPRVERSLAAVPA